MRVLVTGGSGFIGSHILDKLVNCRFVTVSIDNKLPAFPISSVFYEKVDIADFKKVQRIFAEYRPKYVIHCAAQARIQKGIDDPLGTFESNCRGTLNILLASQAAKVKRVVYSASSSAYGICDSPQKEDMSANPLNPYALFKFFGEGLCRVFSEVYGLETVSLRYFNVYGPRQPLEGIYTTVIAKFIDQWQKGLPFTIVPDGHQRRDFTYVSDVVWANINAMFSVKVGRGEVINIGSGKNYSIWEIAEAIGGENCAWEIIEPRKAEMRETLADISRARKLLDWEPLVSLEKGIEIMKSQIGK